MTRGIDLAQLRNVATAGEPRDSVPVTRRFLAQVYAELQASRTPGAELDYDGYNTGWLPVGVPAGDSGAVAA